MARFLICYSFNSDIMNGCGTKPYRSRLHKVYYLVYLLFLLTTYAPSEDTAATAAEMRARSAV